SVFLVWLIRPASTILFSYTTLFRSRGQTALAGDRTRLRPRREIRQLVGEIRLGGMAARVCGLRAGYGGIYGRTRHRGGTSVGFQDRKSTRLNSSHVSISYAVF